MNATADHGRPFVVVAGRRYRPLERIGTIGEILGLTRSTAYRVSVADCWDLVGPPSSRWALTIATLQRYQIPFTLEAHESIHASEHEVVA